MEKAFGMKEKTWVKTLKVWEQGLTFLIFRKSELAYMWRMEENIEAGRLAGDSCNSSGAIDGDMIQFFCFFPQFPPLTIDNLTSSCAEKTSATRLKFLFISTNHMVP